MNDHRKLDQMETDYNKHLSAQTALHAKIRELRDVMHKEMEKIQHNYEQKIDQLERDLERNQSKVPEFERNITKERERLAQESKN